MGQRLSEENLDLEVDAALERARQQPEAVRILTAAYHGGEGMEFLEMKLSDGRRLLVPREELGELTRATDDEARDLVVLTGGTAVYWPRLDDGLDLWDFLQYRWRREQDAVAA